MSFNFKLHQTLLYRQSKLVYKRKIPPDGEVVGISQLKISHAHAEGVAFAVRSNIAKEFLERDSKTKQPDESKKRAGSHWMSSNKANKGRFIGISYYVLSADSMAQLRHAYPQIIPADVDAAVFVESITVGSPAHWAGINPGDVILSINGQDVSKMRDIAHAFGDSSSNNLHLKLINRDGDSVDVKIEFG